MKQSVAKPFVKWVGGKSQLLPEIAQQIPKKFFHGEDSVYVEPFVGGGAVLFWILQAHPHIKKAVINDINTQLITTYRVVKEKPVELIELLRELQEQYLPKSEEERMAYFFMQRERYNYSKLSEEEIAALFIFLNRTCFNGLYRVNMKGAFNVPHGRYTHPKICDEETILADSRILQGVDILCGDFEQMAAYASSNVLYYLDPPYKPLSKTSSFSSYTSEGFGDEDQIRLGKFCWKITKEKASFILSNSDLENTEEGDGFFENLYKSFSIRHVMAKRAVNAVAEKRGKISELLISNTGQFCR